MLEFEYAAVLRDWIMELRGHRDRFPIPDASENNLCSVDSEVIGMMTGPEVNALLEQAFEAMFPGFLMASARKQYARLRTEREQCTACDTRGYDMVLSALEGCGSVITKVPNQRIVLLITSGAAKKNPSVAELEFLEHTMIITTWAKEGMISQKTAQKALQDIQIFLGI